MKTVYDEPFIYERALKQYLMMVTSSKYANVPLEDLEYFKKKFLKSFESFHKHVVSESYKKK